MASTLLVIFVYMPVTEPCMVKTFAFWVVWGNFVLGYQRDEQTPTNFPSHFPFYLEFDLYCFLSNLSQFRIALHRDHLSLLFVFESTGPDQVRWEQGGVERF